MIDEKKLKEAESRVKQFMSRGTIKSKAKTSLERAQRFRRELKKVIDRSRK